MLSILLATRGIAARALSAKTLLNEYLDEMDEKRASIVLYLLCPTFRTSPRTVCCQTAAKPLSTHQDHRVWSSQEPVEQVKEKLQPVQVDGVTFQMQQAVEQITALTTVTESMLPAPVPENEEERLEELRRLDLLIPRRKNFTTPSRVNWPEHSTCRSHW